MVRTALITALIDEPSRRRLTDELGIEVEYRPFTDRHRRLSETELTELLDGVEILVVGYESVSADVLDAAPDLQVVACTRGGPEANVDIEAATDRNVPVLYTPGRNAVSVADFTLGLVVAAARNVARGHNLLRTGFYTGEPGGDAAAAGSREDVTWGISEGAPYNELRGPELADKTLGIVGFGVIGRKVAARALGFDMDVVAYDPYVGADEMRDHGVAEVPLDELCRQSRFVTLHVPVTDDTRGLLGRRELDLLSDDAYVINTARGAVLDQDALVETLETGELGGAALDVYDREPLPDDHPLLDLENVVTTPHIAGAATEVTKRHSEMAADGVAALLGGGTPEHVANPDALSGFHGSGGQ
jgi:D-3-phosphoglycerate dehydrogenase